MGKAHLTPLKPITIPRLKLTAALLSAKIGTMMKKELNVSQDIYWMDSMTVIRYINNKQAGFQTFVANSVQAIRDRTEISQWKYVDSKDNPADDASQGMKIDKFLLQRGWIRGPKFLWKPETDWPEYPTNVHFELDGTVNLTMVERNDILQRLEYFS